MDLDSVRALKQRVMKSVIEPVSNAQTGTIAVGITGNERDGYRLAIRIQDPTHDDNSPTVAEIIRQAGGMANVDIRKVGRAGRHLGQGAPAAATGVQNRYLTIGCTVGGVGSDGGTLGCFVRDRSDGSICLLSNNHVLAAENLAEPGTPILFGGEAGVEPRDRVATLKNYIPLEKQGGNLVDCAIGVLLIPQIDYDPTTISAIGMLAGLGSEVPEGTPVAKLGFSGPSTGRVVAAEIDGIFVQTLLGQLRFDGQIEIDGDGGPFAQPGDSGSLVVDRQRMLGVGLVLGGIEDRDTGKILALANPLHVVMDKLGVDLVLAKPAAMSS